MIPASAWFGPMIAPAELGEMISFLGANNGVAVLVWPRDQHHLDRLDAVGIPRLLLVSATDEPPPRGLLQDSALLSAPDADIHRRLVRLCRSAATRRLHAGLPVVDADGRLLLGRYGIDLPGCLAELARVLAGCFETPVPESALLACLPPDHRSAQNLAGQTARLSEFAGDLGLEVVAAGPDAYLLRRCRALLEWSPGTRHPLRTRRLGGGRGQGFQHREGASARSGSSAA